MTPTTHSLHNVFVLLAACAFTVMSPSGYADELQDASKLLKQGQTKPALEQVDAYLAAHPKDASGRFLRGVILTEMNRSSEAIGIFAKLTEDYPDLPGPYTNLAVIYAQQKQYDKAKTALEAAIRTHPSYATAHENLGDIYARLASQAYDKALQLDSSNKAAQTKLSMIQDLMTVPARGSGVPIAPSAIAAVSKPIAAAAPPVVMAAIEPPAKPVAVPAPATRLIANAVASKSEPIPAIDDASDAVAKVLAAWAEAWSHKDVKSYLAFYASDFKTPGGKSRAAWTKQRTKRVTKPGRINVTIESAKVEPEGADQVVVKFRQHYQSASLSSSSNKTLLMTRQNGQWKILQERIGG
jgi:tetratricopeptide (TPR) repeat protein